MNLLGKDSVISMAVTAAALVLFHCGGGDSDCMCNDITGTWSTTEETDASDCGSGTYTSSMTYVITQSGCNLTVMPAGTDLSFSGSICNNTLSWSGSFPEEGGTTTISSMSCTLTGSPQNTFTGSSHWVWSGGGTTCSGSTQITGTRSE